MNSCSILVGFPSGGRMDYEQKIKNMLYSIRDFSVAKVEMIYSLEDFRREISSGKFNAAVVFDNLGTGNEYSYYYQKHWGDSGKVFLITVMPIRCRGSRDVKTMAEAGLYNGIFTDDLSAGNIAEVILNPRSREAAFTYYGLNAAPEVSAEGRKEGETEKKAERESRLDPQTKQVGNGVTVTRIHANAAKLNDIGEIGMDDVLLEILNEGGVEDIELSPIDAQAEEAHIHFPEEEDWLVQYKQELQKYFKTKGLQEFQAYENGSITKEEFESYVMEVIRQKELEESRKQELYSSFMRDMITYGRIDDPIMDRDVSDIRLLNKDTVNVQIKGVWHPTNIKFSTNEEYSFFIRRLCTKNHKSINVAQAQRVFSDIDTFPDYRLRFTVTHSLLNTSRTETAHIRKVDKRKKTAQDLINEKFWTLEEARFLISAMRKKKSIIICGGSGAGKTVALNCLIEYADENVCGVCAQQAEEIFSDRLHNMEFMHTIEADGDSRVEYSLRQLTTMALLKNAALFIIGEIKGDEARDFFTASNTGAQSLCTTHADSIFEAIPRIADLAMYKADYSQEDLLKMLSRSIDYIVFMNHYHVDTIAGVVGWDDIQKDIIYDIYNFHGKRAA